MKFHCSVHARSSKIDVGQLDRDICTVLEGDFLGAPSQRLKGGRTFDIVLAEGCIPYQHFRQQQSDMFFNM